jgi:transposase
MKHTEEEWNKVLELYQKGYGPTLISRITGICERHIRHKCRQYDLTGAWNTKRKTNVRPNAELKMSVIKAVEQHSLSLDEITVNYGISLYCLKSWRKKFHHGGYKELLATKPKGRPPKMPKPKKSTKGMSELERLREENEYLKAENAYLKKLKALDQEENAEMFGIGPRSSEN